MWPELTRATPADRERVLTTVLSALRHDPVFAFFFPDPETFDLDSRALVGHLFDKRVRQGTVWIACGGASVSMWKAPGSERGDLGVAPEFFGETANRLTHYGDVLNPLLPKADHWYLGVVATHPHHAGSGLEPAVMGPGLQSAAEAGLPVYLETSVLENVDRHRREGFVVESQVMLRDLPIWVMRKDPISLSPNFKTSGTRRDMDQQEHSSEQ
jgi:hypothetical protein